MSEELFVVVGEGGHVAIVVRPTEPQLLSGLQQSAAGSREQQDIIEVVLTGVNEQASTYSREGEREMDRERERERDGEMKMERERDGEMKIYRERDAEMKMEREIERERDGERVRWSEREKEMERQRRYRDKQRR